MIVVDTNVIIYSYVDSHLQSLAVHLRGLDAHWRIPTLWRSEFLNFLGRFVTRKGCDLPAAQKYWRTAFEDLQKCEQDADMGLALVIACEHGITAYDAQYIALAHTLGTWCITEDKVLLKKFPEHTRSLRDFCSEA